MKKALKFGILGLFVGLTSLAFAQSSQVDLDQLAEAVGEAPENTAALVEEAVRSSLGQTTAITDRLMAEYPDLTEEIMFGAIAGLPTPLSEEDLSQLLTHTVLFRPGLTPDIVLGARRATTPAMEPVITSVVRGALQRAIGEGGLGVIGRTSQSAVSDTSYNPTIRVISPSSNE